MSIKNKTWNLSINFWGKPMNNYLEIERKYLVKKADLPCLKKYKHISITQGFICLAPCIRVRKAGDKYYLTIKSKPYGNKTIKRTDVDSDLVRAEYEIEINKNSYQKLLRKCEGRIVKKERYFIPYKKYVIELNIYKGRHLGHIDAEVEFKKSSDAKRFVAPDWFYKDVTGVEKYKNTSLSKL